MFTFVDARSGASVHLDNHPAGSTGWPSASASASRTGRPSAAANGITRSGRNLTDIFVTHGHGDHWFTAGLLADRFGARVVASAGRSSRCGAPPRPR